jgi:hypothetical protein
MMVETTGQPVTALRCWSCDGEIALNENFCRHCGSRLKSGASPSRTVHDRLVAIEKRLLHILIGVGVALLLIGWILLQLYHFGKGGILG